VDAGSAGSTFGASGTEGATGSGDAEIAAAGGALGSAGSGGAAGTFARASGLPISTTVTVVVEVEAGVSARNALVDHATSMASKRDIRVFMVKGEKE